MVAAARPLIRQIALWPDAESGEMMETRGKPMKTWETCGYNWNELGKSQENVGTNTEQVVMQPQNMGKDGD